LAVVGLETEVADWYPDTKTVHFGALINIRPA
jgi:hypothetical protein